MLPAYVHLESCLRLVCVVTWSNLICFSGYSLSGVWLCLVSLNLFFIWWHLSGFYFVIVMNNTPDIHLQIFVWIYSFLLELLEYIMRMYLDLWGITWLVSEATVSFYLFTVDFKYVCQFLHILVSNCCLLWLSLFCLLPPLVLRQDLATKPQLVCRFFIIVCMLGGYGMHMLRPTCGSQRTTLKSLFSFYLTYVLGPELGSSGLLCKHFTNWAILIGTW